MTELNSIQIKVGVNSYDKVVNFILKSKPTRLIIKFD